MKLVNTWMQQAYLVKKVGPYTLFQGELDLSGKEQSLRWECVIDRLDAVLLGTPRIEILPTSKKGDLRLLEECLFTIKIDGEPALEMVPILDHHSRLYPSTGQHAWFEASENDERCGIFITNGAMIQAIVLAPKVVPIGIRLKISLEAELYQAPEET